MALKRKGTGIFKLRRDLMSYFRDSKLYLSNRLKNSSWLLKLAFLGDIFSKVNKTCASLEGK